MTLNPDDPLTEEAKEILEGDLHILVSLEWSDFRDWMLEQGKTPSKDEGLSKKVVHNYVSRLDQIHRLLWRELGQDPVLVTPDRASTIIDFLQQDEFCRHDGDAYSEDSKRKFVNALQKYATWKEIESDDEAWAAWEPHIQFNQQHYQSADTFSLEEFGRLTEAAQEYNELPDYEEVTPEERDKINAKLAVRLHKPKSCIGPDDWEHEGNGAKIPSLVMTAQDIGLPPIEIHRADTSWVDLTKGVLDIPEEQASKNRVSDELSLSDNTQEKLAEWLEEREQYEKYDGRDALWLNADGNRYNSQTLNDLLDNLCEEADIDTEGRDIYWYSIRHTTGTYVRAYDSLGMAGDILRHSTLDTTREIYAGTIIEAQRNTVNGIRQLGSARADGEMSEEDVARILSSDTSILLDLIERLTDEGESVP